MEKAEVVSVNKHKIVISTLVNLDIILRGLK